MRSVVGRALVIAVVAISGCKDSKSKLEEKQRALDAAKAQEKQTQQAARAEEKPPERPLDPYWDDASAVVIRHEKACPEGLWALFDGPAPGGDDATRKLNEANRASIAKSLREKTFIARLRGPEEVKLEEYDAPKGHFPLKLKGVIDCEDSIGRIAVAVTEAKAIPMPTSALNEGAPSLQMMWDAAPKPFTVPMKSMSEAKAFRSRHQFGMEAYVVFKPARTETHRKLVKTAKETQGEVSIGGSTDDYGAGRLIRADVQAIRILANPGPVVVVDTRDPGAVSLR